MAAPKSNETRKSKLQQMNGLVTTLETDLAALNEARKQLNILESVSLGLYEEIEKLCKKAPAETLTDLALQQINDVVRETKELVREDAYVQRLKEFVAAGDNPELRDSLMVLRQIRQGLERFKVSLADNSEIVDKKLNEARFVQLALILDTSGRATHEDDLKQYRYGDPLRYNWMTGTRPNLRFNFELVERTDLAKHFHE